MNTCPLTRGTLSNKSWREQPCWKIIFCNNWDSGVFSPSSEVFDDYEAILVVSRGFRKGSHEIPSDELEGRCDGDELEHSNSLACWFDALTQVTLIDVGRDKVLHVGPVILDDPTMGGCDKIRGKFVVGHGGCRGRARGAPK